MDKEENQSKVSRERQQSASHLDHGGSPRKDDTGWPEGPDGTRKGPRKVTDETQNPGESQEDVAHKQATGQYPAEPDVDPEGEEVEEEDEHGVKRKVKKKRK
jgi:hypothetical protein